MYVSTRGVLEIPKEYVCNLTLCDIVCTYNSTIQLINYYYLLKCAIHLLIYVATPPNNIMKYVYSYVLIYIATLWVNYHAVSK